MKYCAGHLEKMGAAIRRRGWGRYINNADAQDNITRWIAGTAQKSHIDPLVIMMLELGAKAARIFNPMLQGTEVGKAKIRGDVAMALAMKQCPLCVICRLTEDADEDVPQIEGMIVNVVEPIMAANGRKAA